MAGTVIIDSILLVCKRHVKPLVLALTPKEIMILAHLHQMHSGNDFLV